jgi:hypothetical protein
MIDVYEISEQSEMSLSEHKSWDHEILLLNDKQPKWMPLYSMSEDQLKKVRTYLDKNLKEDSSDHQSHWQNTQSVCIKEEWHKATMCQLQTTQQDN